MLTIAKLAAGSEGYYLSTVASGVEDYYVGTGEAPGYWTGAAAAHGLSGEVDAADLREILGGHLPGRGRLPGLRGSRRIPGFDATVNAPKSVSLLYALADPTVSEQVREAHDAAVAAAVGYLEGQAAFVRRGAQGLEQVPAEGLVAAAFRHRTSRNLDPHLHTHVLIANQGQAVDDGLWRTLDARYLYAQQTTAGYLYQAVLRWELTTRLGVAWGPVVNGHADLAGVPRDLIEAFSTRSAEMADFLAVQRGEASDGEVREGWTAKEAQLAAHKTRQAKQRLADGAPLRLRWREQATALGWTPERFDALLGQTEATLPSADALGRVAVELAGPDGLTAERSTFDLGDVVRGWVARLPHGAPADVIVALATRTVADRDIAVALLDPDPQTADAGSADLVLAGAALRRLADETGAEVAGSAALAGALTPLLAAGWDVEGLTARLTERELDSAEDAVAVLTWRARRLARDPQVAPADQAAPEVTGQVTRGVAAQVLPGRGPVPGEPAAQKVTREVATEVAPGRSPISGDPAARQVTREVDGGVDWQVVRRDDGRLTVSKGRARYSTPELLAVEAAALHAATGRRGERVAVTDPASVAAALHRWGWLDPEQRTLVTRVTSDVGGVQVVVGQAGAGKTVALAAAAAAFDSAGITVRGCALSARAALQLHHDAAISSTTIAAVLRDLDHDRPLAAGSVLIVDEAAMVDTRTLARLLHAAQQARAKLVLVGDPAQLPELAAGGLFAGLTRRLNPITLTRNRRQRHGWDRDALAALRAGDPATLIRTYQQHHRLTVAGTDADAARRLASDWAAWAVAQPAETRGAGVMLAARQVDVDALNRHARRHLHTAGRLPADALTVHGRGYAVGDRVVCLRNNRRLGVTNGTRAAVTHLDPATGTTTVQPDGDTAEAVLPGWYLDAGHLAHGYAVTAHKAQGATVDRAWVHADPRCVYAEWLYTALSRHRDTAHLHTSVTTLDQLAIELETHDPRPRRAARGEEGAVAALQANTARSRAHTLATDHTPAPHLQRDPADPAPAPARVRPVAPRPPGPEWPEPLGLSL